jgi:methyl-accepting chemotaxis protein
VVEHVTIDRLDLRPTLILAFVLVAALVAVTGVVGYTSLSAVDTEAHEIADEATKVDAALDVYECRPEH